MKESYQSIQVFKYEMENKKKAREEREYTPMLTKRYLGKIRQGSLHFYELMTGEKHIEVDDVILSRIVTALDAGFFIDSEGKQHPFDENILVDTGEDILNERRRAQLAEANKNQ